MPSFISSSPVAATFKLVHMLLMLLSLLFLIAPFSLGFVEDGGQGVLAPEEVAALHDIAKELGKHDMNFTVDLTVDPCSNLSTWFTPYNANMPAYYNTITCGNCSGGICHVKNVSIKGQSLNGTLPRSLMKLPYLEVIDLARNYLTGTIPQEWTSMNLTYLSVMVNQLSGSIPSYLGNFKTLTYISLENNRFSGTVPPELGKLTNLQNLTLSTNSLTGQLPRELTNLINLQDLRLSSNNFTGRIPDYFHSWKNLIVLEMLGSGFQGPIPDNISALNNLTELRISDLTGEGSELPSLTNMANLKYLMLRNCNISGYLPQSWSALRQLSTLDLSFNKLEGPIPNDFSQLSKLNKMFLTSNFLNGSIPGWIYTADSTIDLSYNNFNESSISSSSCGRANLNLYRSFSRTSNSTLGLCPEQTNCSKDLYKLHINCGGEETTIGEITYQKDDDGGGAAKLFMANDHSWGFSSTGDFWNWKSGDYKPRNTSLLTMSDSVLYTEARRSGMSLTYYGRCLASGSYTVKLYFAEIIFKDNNSFYSLGTRLFDIYIQEKLVRKDFDIRRQANGTDKPCILTFNNTQVKRNIEIRFYYAGKGSTAVPHRGVYGPLISAISVESEFSPPIDWKKVVKIVVAVASSLGLLFVVFGTIWWKRHQQAKLMEQGLRGLDLQTGLFTYCQLQAATNNFDAANKVGEGGFGSVYKGTLLDGTHIAVKQLFSRSEGNREFVNELGIISSLNHPNLVRLYGCCVEGGQLFLVYEYMVNNNLGRALFGPENDRLRLDWPTRHKICIGLARGLSFLHEESPIKIVHRDIKATNILLDGDLNTKISDFGLARLDEEEKTHISTRVAGTIGYMAPEYVLWGHLTYKADVYSFGVVALEIVAGRSNMKFRPSENHFCLLDWALCLRQEGKLMELIDPRLGNDYNEEEALRMIKIAFLCTNPSPSLRPTMSAVLSMLEGSLAVPESTMDPNTYSNERMLQASRKQRGDGRNLEASSETHGLLQSAEPHEVISFSKSADLYSVNLSSS